MELYFPDIAYRMNIDRWGGKIMNDRIPLDFPSHSFLCHLLREDPQAYEELRRELITQVIDSAPESIQNRLKGLQLFALQQALLGLQVFVQPSLEESMP